MRIAERIENVSQFKDVPRDNHKPPTTSQSFTHSRCHLLTSLFCTCFLLLFFDVVILVILCYIFKRWLIMWLVHHIINVSIYSIHPNRHPWVNQPTNQLPTTIHPSILKENVWEWRNILHSFVIWTHLKKCTLHFTLWLPDGQDFFGISPECQVGCRVRSTLV